MAYSQFDRSSQASDSLSPQAPKRSSARWFPLLGAGVGLVGLIAGVMGCSRPAASTEAAKPAYSEQQVADAKKAVCEAYAKGMKSIRAVASRKAENDAEALPVAVNSRVGEIAVSTYFINSLAANPAAPSELHDSLSQLAQQYQEVVLIQLADGAPADWQKNKEMVDEQVARIDQICR